MIVAGIIAEYNPFHNGHKFHIEETRRLSGADYIIAAISGDFVQRGAPALLDKFLRAKMALENGADLVLELPVTTALSSAEGFATGGVCLMERLGVVDYLSFGCESAENAILFGVKSAKELEKNSIIFDTESLKTPLSIQPEVAGKNGNRNHAAKICPESDKQTSLFAQIAKLLAEEPPAYRARLQAYLKTGMSFPKARQLAVTEFVSEGKNLSAIDRQNPLTIADNFEAKTGKTSPIGDALSCPETRLTTNPTGIKSEQEIIADLLSLPNNTLGLEYQKAIYRHNARLKTCIIPRRGSDYGDTRLSGEFSSAAAIREELFSYTGNTSPIVSNRAKTATEAFVNNTRHTQTETRKHNMNILADDTEASASDSLKILCPYVPASVLADLADVVRKDALLTENDFSEQLFYALLSNRERLSDYASANSDLTLRIGNLLEQFEDIPQFITLLKTKNQTYTAISRCLFRILLGITSDDLALAAKSSYAPYARILGFRKSAAPLIKELTEKSGLPIIRQPAKDISLLSPETRHLFALDVFASDLYSRVLFSQSNVRQKSELRRPLIVL